MARRRLQILITAGPTREAIDQVRFLSNYSTGYMGAELARQSLRRGHSVTVIHGPISEAMPSGVASIRIETARELERVLRQRAPQADAIIMAAAIADFRPARRASQKLKRRGQLTLRLRAIPDVIGRLPRRKGQIVAGFALESSKARSRGWEKLRRKHLDLVIAQETGRGSPFGRRKLSAWMLAKNGSGISLGYTSKTRVARLLLDKVERLWYGDKIPKR